jgi:hypothetical protein
MNKNKSSIKKNNDIIMNNTITLNSEINSTNDINNIKFLLVEKDGNIKELMFNKFNINELYKKCGFRKPDNFECRTLWKSIKNGKNKHSIEVWSRNDGKPNTENKYEFPPPIDKDLYFGNCAILQIDLNTKKYKNLTKDLWLKLYEILFGKFENLNDTYENDEDEEDELLNVKKELKTKKTGYLKDDFVVDSEEEDIVVSETSSSTDETSDNDKESTDDSEISNDDEEQQDDDEYDMMTKSKKNKTCDKKVKKNINNKSSSTIYINQKNVNNNFNDELYFDDITNGSELTFEEYDYDL